MNDQATPSQLDDEIEKHLQRVAHGVRSPDAAAEALGGRAVTRRGGALERSMKTETRQKR
jgi:hypothetical protein